MTAETAAGSEVNEHERMLMKAAALYVKLGEDIQDNDTLELHAAILYVAEGLKDKIKNDAELAEYVKNRKPWRSTKDIENAITKLRETALFPVLAGSCGGCLGKMGKRVVES